VHIPIGLGIIANNMNLAAGNQTIGQIDGEPGPTGPDVKNTLPHLCQLLIADWPLHEEEIHMALFGYVNARVPFTKVQFCVAGEVADAGAMQATPPHQQPGPDQAGRHHYRYSHDQQRQRGAKPQGHLHLSEQYGTPTLAYLNNLSFNKACRAHNSQLIGRLRIFLKFPV
jgi:hypothetical protein